MPKKKKTPLASAMSWTGGLSVSNQCTICLVCGALPPLLLSIVVAVFAFVSEASGRSILLKTREFTLDLKESDDNLWSNLMNNENSEKSAFQRSGELFRLALGASNVKFLIGL